MGVSPPTRPDQLATLRTLARVMDSAVRIPGTPIRFGADALIGLVPGLGDVAGAAVSGYLILAAARLGAPASVLLMMALNVGLDMLVGAVPLVGDLLDVGLKANQRNLALLERSLDDPRGTRRSSTLVVVGVLALLVAIVAAGAWLAFLVARAIIQLF